ncbi:Valine--tRNA ligase [bioreactor metagenome]|uniref:valine--tRNA ligase n=1 Tax=bioreactor metagenome TaxID=1076179 RepID=A0A645D7Q2_9ZZZZ
MIVFGLEEMENVPFDTVYVHGIVRDELGRKMSKSLGNGIDPLEIIRDFGADSLRFSLVTGNSAGNDMRFYIKKVEAARNFCNKVYNATRFVLMNLADEAPGPIDMDLLDSADKWILHRLNTVVGEVTFNLDNFDLNLAAQKIYDFIWTEFCDWYIELAKPRLSGADETQKTNVRAILVRVLGDSMKLLHPFMPFITEELYLALPGIEETVMLSPWPAYQENLCFPEEAETMERIMDVIRSIRNLRAEMNVPPAKRAAMTIVTEQDRIPHFQAAAIYLMRLAGAESVSVQADKTGVPDGAVSAVCESAEVYIPLNELIDVEKEKERVRKEMERVRGEIARAEGKLSNESFVAKAPEKVICAEREKLQTAQGMLQKLEQRLGELK